MNEEKCIMCGEVIPEGKMVCLKCENLEPNFNTTKITISLNKIVDVSKFVALTSKCKGDVVVKTGRFAVNAKSIMGLFSLDLTKPVVVEFYCDIPLEVRDGIKKFVVD